MDRPNNTLVVVGSGAYYMTSTEIDFSLPGITKGFQSPTSVDLSRPSIDSTTVYNILQNSVIIASNVPDTFLFVAGLTSYNFPLEYTTDRTNFVSKKFYNAVFHPTSNLTFFPKLPPSLDTASVASKVEFSDPYTGNELLVPSGNFVYKYDIAAGTNTLFGEIRAGAGNAANRQWSNKKMYFKTVPSLTTPESISPIWRVLQARLLS